MIGSISAMFNACRFVWSWATDYLSYKWVYGLLLSLQIIFNLTIRFIAKNEILFGVWICLIVFCEGGHFTLVPNVLKKLFGDNATQLYGIMFTYVSMSGLILLVLTAAIIDKSYQSYETFFLINGGLSAISLLLLICLFSEGKRSNRRSFPFF